MSDGFEDGNFKEWQPGVGTWFWTDNGTAAGETPWMWNSDGATIELRITYDPPSPTIFDLISLSDYNLYLSPKTPKPPPETGWTRIHEKIKSETIKSYLRSKVNSHVKKHHRINHNHHRRFN